MRRLLIIIFTIFFLSACSPKAINSDDGKKTAQFLINELNLENNNLEVVKKEYADGGIYDVYELNESITIIMNDKGGVDRINFINVDGDEVRKILTLIKFPESSSIERVLKTDGSTFTDEFDDEETLVEYQGVGVTLVYHSEFIKDLLDYNNPFTLQLLFDENTIAEYKEDVELRE